MDHPVPPKPNQAKRKTIGAPNGFITDRPSPTPFGASGFRSDNESEVPMNRGILAILLLLPPAFEQWLNLRTPGIPRTADGRPNLAAPAPKTADGKPDLSGLWMPTRPRGIPPEQGSYASLQYFISDGSIITMRPEAQALYNKRLASFGAGRPSERCLPHSIPDAMLVPGPVKFV